MESFDVDRDITESPRQYPNRTHALQITPTRSGLNDTSYTLAADVNASHPDVTDLSDAKDDASEKVCSKKSSGFHNDWP